MSTRAMAQRYGFTSNGSDYMANGDFPGIIDYIRGTAKEPQGGFEIDKEGKVIFKQFEDKGGYTGRRSKALMATYGSKVYEMQALQEMQKMINKQEKEMAKLKAKHDKALEDNKAINEFAKSNNIHPGDVDAIREAVKTTALTTQQGKQNMINREDDIANRIHMITAEALSKPDVANSFTTKLIADNQKQDAENRSKLKLDATLGGIASVPGPLLKGDSVVYGGTRNDSVFTDKFGMTHLITTMTPGKSRMAVDPAIRDSVLKDNDNSTFFGLSPTVPESYNDYMNADPTTERETFTPKLPPTAPVNPPTMNTQQQGTHELLKTLYDWINKSSAMQGLRNFDQQYPQTYKGTLY